MKKAISLLVLGVLLLVISGCGTDEFSSALKNTNEATSYQMELEMQVPIVGTINATIMMEENKSYIRTTGSTSIFGGSVTTEETYAEVVGDVTFEYYQDVNGKWVKRNEADSIFSNGVVDSEVDSEIAGLEDEIFEEIDPNEFTKDDDGYYVGSIELEGQNVDLKIKIANGYIKEIIFEITNQGLTFDVNVTVSKYNEVTVNLPTEYYEYTYEDEAKEFLGIEGNIEYVDGYFQTEYGGLLLLQFTENSKEVMIVDSFSSGELLKYTYNTETKTVKYNTSDGETLTMSVEEFVASEEASANALDNLDIFIALDYLVK